jgi:EAL domain-containing protein (putative c-di-GMP-specific phosphodiesterase class I)
VAHLIHECPGAQAVACPPRYHRRNLGLTSVAEGIESRVTLEQIRNIGAYEVQGFFLGEPAPPQDAFEAVSDLQTNKRR